MDVNIAIYLIFILMVKGFFCPGKNYLFVLAFLLPAGFLAQSFLIGSPTPLFTIKNASFTPHLAGSIKNYLLSDADVNATPRIHLFAVSGNTLYDEDIEMPGSGKERGAYLDVIGTKEKMFLLRSLYKKSDRKKYLYVHPVTLQIQVDPLGTEIAAIPADKANKSGEFGINVSEKGNYAAVFSQYPAVKGAKEKFSVTVLDAQMKKKWSREFEFPVTSEKEPFNDVYISDKGTVFIMKRMDAENFSGFILKNETSTLVECKLDLPKGKKIMNFQVAFNESDEAIVCGFYTESADVVLDPSFNGSYFFSVSADAKIETRNTNAFPSKMNDLNIRYLIPVEENKVLLAAEVYKREGTGVGAGMAGGERVLYSSGNVHLFMFDNSGKTLWTSTIKKESKSVDDGGLFSQFGLYKVKDKFLVFFNDEESKYSMNKGKVPFMIAVKKDGTQEKPLSLLSRRVGGEGEVFLLPSVGVGDNSAIHFMGVSEESFFPLKFPLTQ